MNGNRTVTLRAFAKINLDLKVLGRRPDGYHEIRTILQTIDWFDEILVDRAGRFEFLAHGVPADSNLVVQAVREFERLTGETVSARVELFKRIPVGAGLGGGSADAAVTVLGLQRFYSRSIPQDQLFQCLRRLGSDVPFFALGGKALGGGRGDEVAQLEDDTGYWIVLVNAGVPILTAEAYSWLTVSDKFNTIVGFRERTALSRAAGQMENDFEGVVFDHHPILADIKTELLRLGASHAALSGSGSTMFGTFDNEADAVRAALPLERYGAVKVTRPLSRAEYLRRIFQYLEIGDIGAWPSGKAQVFESCIRRFESFRPSFIKSRPAGRTLRDKP